MTEFSDKYTQALKQLETYYQAQIVKLREAEQEKIEYLRVCGDYT